MHILFHVVSNHLHLSVAPLLSPILLFSYPLFSLNAGRSGRHSNSERYSEVRERVRGKEKRWIRDRKEIEKEGGEPLRLKAALHIHVFLTASVFLSVFFFAAHRLVS